MINFFKKLFSGGVIEAGADIAETVIKARSEERLSDDEVQKILAASAKGSWKDEYVTLLFSSPFLLVNWIVWKVYSGDVDESEKAIAALEQMLNFYEKIFEGQSGYVLGAIMLAAAGVRWNKSRRK